MRSLLFAAVLGLSLTGAAHAHEYSAGDLRIAHPWTRPTVAGAPVVAGYFEVTNTGKTADRLVSAAAPNAKRVELHQSAMDGGVMRMKALPQGVEIPAGGTVRLAPGGLHLMLMGPNKAFLQGDRIPLTLTFAKAGKVAVQLAAESRPASAPAAMPEDHKH